MSERVGGQDQEGGTIEPQARPSLAPILLVFIGGSLATALVPLMVPIMGSISKEFGVDGTRLGWLVSLPSLICVIGALAFGIVVDRLGDVRVLIAGSILSILGDALVALAPGTSWLFAARLFQGLGYVCLTVGGPAFIQRTTRSETRRAAMAFWAAHTPMGFALAVYCGAQLVAAGLSWRYSFLGHGIAAFLVGIAMLRLRKVESAAELRRSVGTRQVLSSRRPYLVAIGACATALVQTGVMVLMPGLFGTRFALAGPQAALVIVAGMSACWLGAMVIVATPVRHLPKIALPASAVAAGLLALALLSSATESLLAALTFLLLFSLMIGAANSLVWSLMPAAVPIADAGGATAGLITQGSFLGVLLGPPAFFWASHANGAFTGLLVGGLAVLMLLPLGALAAARIRETGIDFAADERRGATDMG